MKKLTAFLLIIMSLMTGCSAGQKASKKAPLKGAVEIILDDEGIMVDGKQATKDTAQAVYIENDIVYYAAGQDFTYGEGSEEDAHEAAEANAHTVVHISKAGIYALSGKLSAGQIAVDLGDDAKNDPGAVVTLLLNGADISCTVAPAVIFYNVYECDTDEECSETVDTSAAGANVFIMDGTENNISGSYVARIYDPKTIQVNKAGTEVKEAEKLHKYDGAFYSKRSMNIDGNDGILNIFAENEGLDSEMHLTINGGDIRINSGNDGINTNEDEVSVTTINDGKLSINVLGTTGEGDGIDSNGWLVINGGTVISSACATSGDAGIDSEMGIYINGGTVIAGGNMLDRIAGGDQTYVVLQFAESQKGGRKYVLKNDNKEVLTASLTNDFSQLVLAGDVLEAGDYTFWCNEMQLAASVGQDFGGRGDAKMPEDMELPDRPKEHEVMTPPDDAKDMNRHEKLTGELPQGVIPPDGNTPPDGAADIALPEMPNGEMPKSGPGGNRGQMTADTELSEVFPIAEGENYFSFVSAMK